MGPAGPVENALELGVQARWFAGDEVYSGRELRKDLRELGPGYAVGVSHTYTVTDGAGRRWKARQMINKVLPHQWMRMRTGHGTKGTREYDWAWLDVRADDTPNGHGDDGTSVLVARQHRYTGSPSSAAGRPHLSPSPSWWKWSADGGGSKRLSNSARPSPAWTKGR